MSEPTSDARWTGLADELARRETEGLRRSRRVVRRLPGGRCEVEGRELLNAASNDYLGLADDARLAEAAVLAAREGGVGAGASPLVSGRSAWTARAEDALARFEGTEAAVLFPSGYAANLGVLSALVDGGDVVFGDRLNHACLVDGVRLSGARLRVFRHDDLETLRRELRKADGPGRRWIVTDGVFGMDGHLAPLTQLCDIAEEFGAEVIVDEAHGTGVFGANGRGACEEAGVEHRVAVRVGTLSKAFGCQGGFVAGPAVLVDWLWNSARTQMFSTALAVPVCGAIARAVEIAEAEPERRQHLRRLSRDFRGQLQEEGLSVPGHPECPIVPVLVGEPDDAVAAGRRLERAGFLAATIRPPTVPRGTSRLRISLSALFTDADIAKLAAAVLDAVPRCNAEGA
jgi:8-amino-7-oxononanoate synthase